MTGHRTVMRQPWFWPALANFLLLALVMALVGEFKFSIVTANLAAASFLAMVGLAQMFPVASGEGGIDLSIPAVMNFCAFLAVRMIGADVWSIVPVLAAAIAFGLAVGLVNGLIIVRLRVPPIIGTLATGFVVLTLVQIISADGMTRIANRTLVDFVRGAFLGIPTPFFAVIGIGAAAAVTLHRTVFGRALLAVGQSRRAAALAGISVNRTVVTAYLICGALAAFTGVALAISVGGADLQLGNPFLLTSVGAVVLGGNRISGGSASVPGTVLGAILLTLLVLAVTVAGLPIEMKHIASGLTITLVLVAAHAPEAGQRAPRALGAVVRRWFTAAKKGSQP